MKAALFLVATATIGLIIFNFTSLSRPQAIDFDDLFDQWKYQYNVQYPSPLEETHRKRIFIENYNKITAHNADPQATYTMGLNQFADLTGDEFTDQIKCLGSGNEGPDPECPTAPNPILGGDYPVQCPPYTLTNQTSVDWSQRGAVTKVKNQGQCGSCWAFASTGALEAQYFLKTGLLMSFSEQYIMDCDSDCQSCDGCFDSKALNFVAKNGIVPEKLYPYKGTFQACQMKHNLNFLHVNSGVQCVGKRNFEQFKAALVQHPFAVSVEADSKAWQFYTGGVMTGVCGYAINHNILLVGYDVEGGYWKIKNSWGPNWGENGYARLDINPNLNENSGMCGILRCGVVPI